MRQAEVNFAVLATSGRHEEAKAILRKRMAEDAAQDITDVAQLAQQLAGDDQWVASLLIPLVQEYARSTTRDIKDFGRGR
ncbi:hypothetical protein [Streptomyces sp. DvalAA-19]|uniref:hypothetical protein n=1 Tax=Streptomyces sp. DvalAA-19 TaxID=1839761 RepID=UPI00081AF57D|nr:hypothetical protein [Streptomyces sp. DvalAA-19]SCE05987.1 hypothetical protein GA0115244_116143 [Streptomyces sp. DvalAA-19]